LHFSARFSFDFFCSHFLYNLTSAILSWSLSPVLAVFYFILTLFYFLHIPSCLIRPSLVLPSTVLKLLFTTDFIVFLSSAWTVYVYDTPPHNKVPLLYRISNLFLSFF
jgi:hypothetical protein